MEHTREEILKALLQWGGWKCVDVPGQGRWHTQGHFAVRWDAEGPLSNPPKIADLFAKPRGEAITFEGDLLDDGRVLCRNASNGALINEAYRLLFADAEWFSTGPEGMLTAVKDGVVIGFVMPMKREASSRSEKATEERAREVYARYSSFENGFAFDTDRALIKRRNGAVRELRDAEYRADEARQEAEEYRKEVDVIDAAIRARKATTPALMGQA